MKLKLVLTILLFVFPICSILAIKVDGYIVNHDQDTLWGSVKLSRFNDINGAIILNGINKEQLHFQMFFKGRNKRTFKRYTPEDIQAFGFKYNEKIHTYQSFEIVKNNMLKSMDSRFRFLRLLNNNDIKLYLDLVRMDDYSGSQFNGVQGYGYQTYFDYYLYNNKVGLMFVSPSNDFKSLIELLKHYDFHPDFIESLPDKYVSKDIPEILLKYEQWLEERKKDIILAKSSTKKR